MAITNTGPETYYKPTSLSGEKTYSCFRLPDHFQSNSRFAVPMKQQVVRVKFQDESKSEWPDWSIYWQTSQDYSPAAGKSAPLNLLLKLLSETLTIPSCSKTPLTFRLWICSRNRVTDGIIRFTLQCCYQHTGKSRVRSTLTHWPTYLSRFSTKTAHPDVTQINAMIEYLAISFSF